MEVPLVTFEYKSGVWFLSTFWHPWKTIETFICHGNMEESVVLDTSHEIDYMLVTGEIEQIKGAYGTISDLEITSDDFASAIFKFKNNFW